MTENEAKAIFERLEHLEELTYRLSKQQRKNTRFIDVGLMTGLSFFLFVSLILIGIRIEFRGILFQVPTEVILKLIELPAIASACTAIAAIFLKKIEGNSQNDRE